MKHINYPVYTDSFHLISFFLLYLGKKFSYSNIKYAQDYN